MFTRGLLHSTPFFGFISRLAVGIPSPTNDLINKENNGTSFTVYSFADLAVPILVLLVLGAAQILVALKRSPLPIWATLMACYSFGWWCIRNDDTASLGLSCAFVYPENSFQSANC